MKKFHLLALACFFNSLNFSHAQTQGIAYTAVGKGAATTFVTDYHCLGINPSALGWGSGYEKYKKTVGGFEANGGLYSEALTSDRLKNFAKTMYNQTKKDADKIDWYAQRDVAAEYAEKGITIDGQYNWAGFAFQGKRFGGIAFNITESYNWYSKLNSQLSDIIFRGKLSSYFDSLTVVFDGDTSVIANAGNISQDTLNNVVFGTISVPLRISEITKGSAMRMVWNRSYNFGYGRKVFGLDSNLMIFAGFSGRFIQSMAMFDLESDEDGLRMYSSISPSFNINYGTVANANVSSFTNYDGGIPPVVGNGYGLDFAVSAILFSKLKVAIAVNNIGSVEYKRNVYSVRDTLVGKIGISGLSDENLIEAVEKLLTTDGLLKLEGEEKYVLPNASNIRLGATFQPFKKLGVGIDFVAPFNKENPGSIPNAIISVGIDFRPFKWMHLSTGFYGGGIFKTNLPLGINFVLRNGKYEFGIASRDALTFFTDGSNTVSGAMGIARVRF